MPGSSGSCFVLFVCFLVCLFVDFFLQFFSLNPAAQVGGRQGEFPQPAGGRLQEKESRAGGRDELQEEERH